MSTILKIAAEIGDQLLLIGAALLRAAVTFVVAWGIARLANRWLEPHLSRQRFGRDGAILVSRLIAIFAYILAFISVMNQLGVEWTGLLTLLSAFTVAIGLSLQDVLKNFFSGILMLLERPFSVGDRVKIRDWEGEIQGIDIRTTLIRNNDGALVYVPNSIMFGEILVNRSHFRTRRIRFLITDSSRPIEGIEAIVRTKLAAMSDVRKPVPEPTIVSISPEGLKLRYSLLVQANDAVEHDIVAELGKVLEGASIEVEL